MLENTRSGARLEGVRATDKWCITSAKHDNEERMLERE